MGIFDQQFQNLETKTKDFLDTMDQKVDKCNKKVDTYQNDYFEWVEQWKVDNSHIIQDFRKALVNQQKQIDQILHALQQQGISTAEPSNPTKPNLGAFSEVATAITSGKANTWMLIPQTTPKRRSR